MFWSPKHKTKSPFCVRWKCACLLIQTKFSAAIWQDETTLKHFEKQLPSGRMAQPDEMVGLALLLSSDAGSYSTGGVYTADGGYMIAG